MVFCPCTKEAELRVTAPNPTGAQREITDRFGLAAFIAFLVGLVSLTLLASSAGDPSRLEFYIDYKGRWCGKGDLRDYKFIHWTHSGNYMTTVCVKECPAKDVRFELQPSSFLGYTKTEGAANCADTYPDCRRLASPYASQGAPHICCTYGATSASPGTNFCVPSVLELAVTGAAKAHVNSLQTQVLLITSDLYSGAYILGFATGGGFILAFMGLQLLRFCAGCFVWGVLVCSLLCGTCLSLASFAWYLQARSETSDVGLHVWMVYIFAYTSAVCVILVICLLCVAARLTANMGIALGLVVEICKCLNGMPSLVIVPVLHYVLFMGFLAFWLWGAIYMASAGEVREIRGGGGAYELVIDQHLQRAVVFHVVALLWFGSICRHMSNLVISGAVAAWYWTPLAMKDKNEYPERMVCASAGRALRYHVGSVAFGAFIISVAQLPISVLAFVKGGFTRNKRHLKCVHSYMDCWMQCFERLLEYVGHHGYVMTAAKGQYLYSASYDAFRFLDACPEVALVGWVGGYLMLLSKVAIASGTTGLAWYAVSWDASLSSPVGLLLVTAFASYVIAAMVLGVFEASMSVIVVSFCCEQDGRARSLQEEGRLAGRYGVYASPELARFLETAHSQPQMLLQAHDDEENPSNDEGSTHGPTDHKYTVPGTPAAGEAPTEDDPPPRSAPKVIQVRSAQTPPPGTANGSQRSNSPHEGDALIASHADTATGVVQYPKGAGATESVELDAYMEDAEDPNVMSSDDEPGGDGKSPKLKLLK